MDTARDDPVGTELGAQRYGLDVHSIVGTDYGDLIGALQFVHRTLRNQEGFVANFCFSLDASKLTGTQQILGIGEAARDLYCSRLGIDLALDKNDVSLVWIDAAVSERELQRHRVPTAEQVRFPSSLHTTRQRKILLLADGKINLDRVYLRDRSERRRRANQIAYLDQSPPRNSRDEGTDFREAQIQLRLLYIRLGGTNRSPLICLLLYVIVELALSDRMGFGQRCVAPYVDISQAKLCLRLRKLPFRLIERRLKWPGINLKQDLTSLYDGAFPVILLDQVARRYLGLNLRIYVSIERGDPIAVKRHVALFHRRNIHLQWPRLWRSAPFLRARAQQQEACSGERT